MAKWDAGCAKAEEAIGQMGNVLVELKVLSSTRVYVSLAHSSGEIPRETCGTNR